MTEDEGWMVKDGGEGYVVIEYVSNYWADLLPI
jgi:hypothetical protein